MCADPTGPRHQAISFGVQQNHVRMLRPQQAGLCALRGCNCDDRDQQKQDHVAPSDEGRSAAGLPCASGDEMVSLGFRVGNPLAIGWHWGRIFQHLLPVAVTPTTSRRIATRGLRRKWRKPKPIGWPAYTSSGPQEGAETIPRGGVVFSAIASFWRSRSVRTVALCPGYLAEGRMR
jgi:hypothetical protein